MAELAREPSQLVRDVAESIQQSGGGLDGFPPALYGWLARHVVEEADPYGVELVRSPEWQLHAILSKGATPGDCDDVATLAAGLALALGYETRFRVVAWAGPFSHVWAEIEAPIARRWHEMDIHRPLQATRPPVRELVYSIAWGHDVRRRSV